MPRGQSLDTIAQPIDILPTLCDLAGATVEPEQPFQGRSFAGAVLGTVAPRHREVAVSGCHVRAPGPGAPREATTPFLVTEHWGYAPVGAWGRPELYDLNADPLAQTDVSAEHKSLLRDLHRVFLDHLTAHGASEAFLSLWQDVPGESAGGGIWAIDYPKETI